MKYRINLLALRKEKSFDRIIFFVLNYLRYILVITQIVVIGVFFFRLKVDQEIVDLQDSINQKKEIIEVSQPLIHQGKITSFKIVQSKNIISNQKLIIAAVDYLLSIFPEPLFLNRFSIKDQSISLAGYTGDLEALRSFYLRLKKEAKFASVELVNIKKTERGLNFAFEISQFKM